MYAEHDGTTCILQYFSITVWSRSGLWATNCEGKNTINVIIGSKALRLSTPTAVYTITPSGLGITTVLYNRETLRGCTSLLSLNKAPLDVFSVPFLKPSQSLTDDRVKPRKEIFASALLYFFSWTDWVTFKKTTKPQYSHSLGFWHILQFQQTQYEDMTGAKVVCPSLNGSATDACTEG